MKESSRLRGLYAITDSKLLADGRLLPYVEAALKGGARLLQYRDKTSDEARRLREADALRDDIVSMRQRMRAELDRSRDGVFDLKQGEGGLVDLEFLVQCIALQTAHVAPDLLRPRATPLLLDAAVDAGLMAPDDRSALQAAHAALVAAGVDCMLDRRPRLAAPSAGIDAARETIRRITAWS